LIISGGSFDITQNLGPAIGASRSGEPYSQYGFTASIFSKVGSLTITDGLFIAKTLGTNDPVIGAGSRAGASDTSWSTIDDITITGGDFDLTAAIPAASPQALPPAIGYPNTDAPASTLVKRIWISDANFKVNAAYFVEGSDAEKRIESIRFGGRLTMVFTAQTGASGLVFGNSTTVESGSWLTVTTPIPFFGTVPRNFVAPFPVIEILYVYSSSSTAVDTIPQSGLFRVIAVRFSTTALAGNVLDLTARPVSGGTVSSSHEVSVDRTKIGAVALSVTIAEGTPSPMYELHYYRWTDGLVGLLCAGNNVHEWALGTDQNLITNAGVCDSGSVGATKTSRPRTPEISGTPTKSLPTAHFTPIEFSADIRRIIRRVSLFHIALLL
jgi:hypothetical protein